MRELMQVLMAMVQIAVVQQEQQRAKLMAIKERERVILMQREAEELAEQQRQEAEEKRIREPWDKREIKMTEITDMAKKLGLPEPFIEKLSQQKEILEEIRSSADEQGMPTTMHTAPLEYLDQQMETLAKELSILHAAESGVVPRDADEVVEARTSIARLWAREVNRVEAEEAAEVQAEDAKNLELAQDEIAAAKAELAAEAAAEAAAFEANVAAERQQDSAEDTEDKHDEPAPEVAHKETELEKEMKKREERRRRAAAQQQQESPDY